MAIPARKWGPPLWDTLHNFSFTFPKKPTKEQQKSAVAFISSLTALIPCDECRVFFKQLLKEEPPEQHVASRFLFSRYIYWMHSRTNEKLGKPNFTFRQTRIRYVGNRAKSQIRFIENEPEESEEKALPKPRKRSGCTRCGGSH